MAVPVNQMPEGIPEPQAPAGPAPIQQGNTSHEAFYDKLRQAQGKIEVVQNVLGRLMGLGDTVTQEDVIKGASKIVSSGVSPEGMAAMLADMPDKQELLGPWIAQHKATFDKQDAAISQMAGQVRHQMGVEALQGAMGGGATPEPPPATSMPSMGNLGPQAGPSAANSLME